MKSSLVSIQVLHRVFLLGFLLALALGIHQLSAWTAPGSAAPTCTGCTVPLHTGSGTQTKTGGLVMSTLDVASSLSVGGVPSNGPYLIDMDAATPGTYAGIRFPDGTVQTSAASGPTGVTNCPTGFTRIGPAGKPGSYCITANEQPSATYFIALNACHDMSTGGAGTAYLCGLQEWYTACRSGADAGQPAFANPNNNREMVDEFFRYSTVDQATIDIGSPSCQTTNVVTQTTSATYRCCFGG